MKKIINGKLYNTETAKEVAKDWNGYSTWDFNYLCETLYLKKTGEWFLFGEGGSFTEYAEPAPGGMVFGKQIIPYTEKKAKEWAIVHMSADEYMELFGEVEE